VLNIRKSEEDLLGVRGPNGVTLGINDMHVMEGADIEVAAKEIGF